MGWRVTCGGVGVIWKGVGPRGRVWMHVVGVVGGSGGMWHG